MGENRAFSITGSNVSPHQKRHHYFQMQMSLSKTNYALHKRPPQDRDCSCRTELGEGTGRWAPTSVPTTVWSGSGGPAPPAARHLTTGCLQGSSSDFTNEKKKKKSGILCTMGLTQLGDDFHVWKESSLIFFKGIRIEPCFY